MEDGIWRGCPGVRKKKRGEKQGLRFERREGKEKKIKVKKPFPSRPLGTVEGFLGTLQVVLQGGEGVSQPALSLPSPSDLVM